MKKLFATLAAAAIALPSMAGEWSDGTVVFLRPDETPLWRTATNSTMRLEWLSPRGASATSLVVEAKVGGWRDEIDLAGGESVDVVLSAPTAPEVENVYDFTLTFDNKETKTASLGVVRGAGAGDGFLGTSCAISDRAMKRIGRRAVLPVPFGATRLVLNDENVDTGLGGAYGWYAWGPLSADAVAGGARLEIGEDEYEASFLMREGFVLLYK